MKKVLGMGNALVDIMTKLKGDDLLAKYNLPKGTMQLVDHTFIKDLLDATLHLPKKISSGGSAANTIHGLSRLGIQSSFLGKVGDDEFGKAFKDDLEKSLIHPMLFYSLSPTGRVFALVSPDGERTFATYLGAAVELSEDDIDSDVFKGYDIFHIEGYLVQNHRLIEKAVRLAKRNHLIVSLDMASHNVVRSNRDFLSTLIEEYVDILFANEEEARAYTGMSPLDALKSLSSECDIAIVKLGEHGSMVRKGKEEWAIRPVNAHCLDTTGAGDLYAAGFIYGLIHDMDLQRCGNIGSLVSGKVIEVLGAKLEEEHWEEIKSQIEKI